MEQIQQKYKMIKTEPGKATSKQKCKVSVIEKLSDYQRGPAVALESLFVYLLKSAGNN